VLIGYNDGSICLWDTIHKQPITYFMTELTEVRVLMIDDRQSILVVGLDKLKREVINIIVDNSVVFRQISNFNVSGALFINKQSF